MFSGLVAPAFTPSSQKPLGHFPIPRLFSKIPRLTSLLYEGDDNNSKILYIYTYVRVPVYYYYYIYMMYVVHTKATRTFRYQRAYLGNASALYAFGEPYNLRFILQLTATQIGSKSSFNFVRQYEQWVIVDNFRYYRHDQLFVVSLIQNDVCIETCRFSRAYHISIAAISIDASGFYLKSKINQHQLHLAIRFFKTIPKLSSRRLAISS